MNKILHRKPGMLCDASFTGKGLMPNGEAKMFYIRPWFEYTYNIYIPFEGVDIREDLDRKKSRFKGYYNYKGKNLPLDQNMRPELTYLGETYNEQEFVNNKAIHSVLVNVPANVFFKEKFGMSGKWFTTSKFYKDYFRDLGFGIVDKFSVPPESGQLLEHLFGQGPDIRNVVVGLNDYIDSGITPAQIIQTLKLSLPPNSSVEDIASKFLEVYSEEVKDYKPKLFLDGRGDNGTMRNHKLTRAIAKAVFRWKK